MQSPVLCAFILVTAGLQLITADHPKLMNAATDVQPHGCSTFMFEGKGDFRVQRKIYATQNPDHFVFALRLIKRTSFYKCEPQETRYGITDDGHSWWVDRGCEAIFEVTECPNNGLLPSPDPLSKLYEEMQRRLAASTSNVDLSAWNTDSFINRFPNLIAMVKSAKDIQAVVKFAHAHNLHVTVRSSGHDYMGRSTWEGSFLINLSEMNEMEIDLNSSRSQYGTVKVQTGLQWQEIYQKLNAVSRVVVGGSAHTVTPGGYTLGGGHSPVSRSLGYAVDNLLEVQIVFADGSIATCTESRTVIKTYDGNFQYVENGDLFWALRGGGHSFGVVVYFLFRLHPMPKGMVTFASTIAIDIPAFGINYFNATMLLLRDLIVTMPTQWGGYWMINNGPGTFPVGESVIQYRGLLSLYFNKFGAWDGTEKAVFKSFTDWATAANVPFTFANKSDFWDFEKDAADPPITRAYLANSLLQPELLTEEFLSFMHSGLFLTSEYLGCTGVTLAGKTTNEPSGGTPLHPGYRSTITSLSCGIVLNDADKDLLDQPNKDQERIEGFWPFAEGLRKYGRGMYVNEAWKDNPYWREDFWGSNYDRLLSVKLRFDPKNFFTCHHCVGSEHLPGPKDGTSVAARMAAPWLLVVLVMGLIR